MLPPRPPIDIIKLIREDLLKKAEDNVGSLDLRDMRTLAAEIADPTKPTKKALIQLLDIAKAKAERHVPPLADKDGILARILDIRTKINQIDAAHHIANTELRDELIKLVKEGNLVDVREEIEATGLEIAHRASHQFLRNLKTLAHNYGASDEVRLVESASDPAITAPVIFADAKDLADFSQNKLLRAVSKPRHDEERTRDERKLLTVAHEADVSDMLKAQSDTDREILGAYFDSHQAVDLHVSDEKITFSITAAPEKDSDPTGPKVLDCTAIKDKDTGKWQRITYKMSEDANLKYKGDDRNMILEFLAEQTAKVAKRADVGDGQSAMFVKVSGMSIEDSIKSAFFLMHNQVIPFFDAENLLNFKVKYDELVAEYNSTDPKGTNMSDDNYELLVEASALIKFKRTAGGDEKFCKLMGVTEFKDRQGPGETLTKTQARTVATNHTLAEAIKTLIDSTKRNIVENDESAYTPETKARMKLLLVEAEAKADKILSGKESAAMACDEKAPHNTKVINKQHVRAARSPDLDLG